MRRSVKIHDREGSDREGSDREGLWKIIKKVRRFASLLRDAVPVSQLVCNCQFVVFRPAWRPSSSTPPAPRARRGRWRSQRRSGGISRAVRRRRGHLRLPPRCLRTNDAGCFAPAPSRIVASTLLRAVRRRQGHLRLPPRCLRTNDAGCFAPAPSRIVASTLVSCRQARARPDSSDASKGKLRERNKVQHSRAARDGLSRTSDVTSLSRTELEQGGTEDAPCHLTVTVVAVTQLPRDNNRKKRGAPKI